MASVDPTSCPLPGRAGASRPLRELLPEGCATRRSRSGPGSGTRCTSGRARPPTGSLWFTLFTSARARARRSSRCRSRRPAAATGSEWGRRGSAPTARAGRSTTAWRGTWRSRRPRSRCSTCRRRGCTARGCRARSCSRRRRRRASRGRSRWTGRTIDVDGWRGMAGHNWGAQHAERWIWLHGLTEDGDWLDAAIGRVKLGPVTTPWVAQRRAQRGRRPAPAAAGRRSREFPDRCTFALSGRGVEVRGTVEAPRERFVGWVYADPGRLRAPRRELLDRRHAADGEAARRRPVRARRSRTPPPTSSACASTTTGSRSSRIRTARARAARPASRRRRACSGGGRAAGCRGAPRTPRRRARRGSRPSRSRTGRSPLRVLAVELRDPALEPLAVRDDLALRGGERAQLALPRAAVGVRLALGAIHPRHRALDAHLAAERLPVEQQRRARVLARARRPCGSSSW